MGGSGPPPATAGRKGGRQPSPCRRRHIALPPPGGAPAPVRSSLALSTGTPGGNQVEHHCHPARQHPTCTSLAPPSALRDPACRSFSGFFGLALFRLVPAPISPSLFAQATRPPQPFSPFSRKETRSPPRTGTEPWLLARRSGAPTPSRKRSVCPSTQGDARSETSRSDRNRGSAGF